MNQPATPRHTTTCSRVFTGRRIWRPTWSDVRKAARLLADAEAANESDVVAGIARGGVWPARMMSSFLRLPFTVVTACHNTTDEIKVQGTGSVSVRMIDSGLISADTRILLVDDICGTGATLRAVLATLAERSHPEPVRTVTLCRNVGASYEPHQWAWDVADWVSFPWEPAPGGPSPVERLYAPTTVRGRP